MRLLGRRLCYLAMLSVIAAAMPAFAAPATTATAPATQPQNLDQALDKEIQEIHFKKLPLHTAIEFFSVTTKTNIAVNWPALALAGINRDTPVTLRLTHVSFENVLRAMLEELPAKDTRPNYLVGGNALEITTNAELGKQTIIKIFNIAKLTALSNSGTPTPKEQTAHADFLKNLVHEELLRAGENPDAGGRGLQVRDDYLVATESRRGLLFTQLTLSRLSTPLRSIDHAPGEIVSVQAKKSWTSMTDLTAKTPLVDLARDPEKFVNALNLNVILLPGVAAELAKPAPDLDYQISPAGIIAIGTHDEIAGRGVFAAYDLRDLLKHLAFTSKEKPPPSEADFAQSIFEKIKSKVSPGPGKDDAWSDLNPSKSSIMLYESELIVIAQPAAHRAIAAALRNMNR